MPGRRSVPLAERSTATLVVDLIWAAGLGGLMVFVLLYPPIEADFVGVGSWAMAAIGLALGGCVLSIIASLVRELMRRCN